MKIPADQGPMSEYDRNGHFLAVRNAERAAVSQEAKLLRPDGVPLYTDHEERVARIRAERDQVVKAKEELVFAELKAADEWITRIDAEQANPVSRLDADELARAANLRGFVEADCRRYSPSDLAPLVQAAVAGDDRGLQSAWWHALLGRIAELNVAEPAGARHSVLEADERAQLTVLVDQLAARLRSPELDKQRVLQVRRQDNARLLQREIRDLVEPRHVDGLVAELAASGQYSAF